MDFKGIYPVSGTLFEKGYTQYQWNPDGTLAVKEMYADAALTQLIYRKTFTWNPDGTLEKWDLLVATDGQVKTKTFVWNSEGQLVDSVV